MTVPRRRWSYSLRTLFVMVTVIGLPLAWLARELYVVHERKLLLSRIRITGGIADGGPFERHYDPYRVFGAASKQMRVSRLREAIGDVYMPCIELSPLMSKNEREQVLHAFPEAIIGQPLDANATHADRRFPNRPTHDLGVWTDEDSPATQADRP